MPAIGSTPQLRDGYYARKQLFTRSWLINWSHRARFDLGIGLAGELAGREVLDYGCGDGTFLALLMCSANPPSAALGVEIDEEVVQDCRARHTDSRLSFMQVGALSADSHAGRFDGLICMEVLEHVVDPEPVLERWRWLVKPGGCLIVSVPVETGPVLLAKQISRRVAGWRGIGDYPGIAPYRWRHLARSIVAGNRQHMIRPIHERADGTRLHCHTGFNWRCLRRVLSARFTIERCVSSPLPRLPAGLGSQVWFVLRNRV
jgi:SAM-dependent methyltransferase